MEKLELIDDLIDADKGQQVRMQKKVMTFLQSTAAAILKMDESISPLAPKLDSMLMLGTPLETDMSYVHSTAASMQEELRRLRRETLRFRIEATQEILTMSEQVLGAIDSLFDMLDHVRRTALEIEADLDVAAGRVRKFGNMSAAIAALRRGR
jgi:hypothetical protein